MLIELSLRAVDGGVGSIQLPADSPLLRCTRLMLLVHGYNNTHKEATEAFDGFERLQRRLIQADENSGEYARDWQVVRVHWPGNAEAGLVSALFYPWIVKNAPESGKRLAEFLHQLAGEEGREVMIVSHSLGCRVAAELIRALPDTSRVRISRVVFFAAAVGLEKLEDLSDHALGAAFARKIQDSALSLYSGNDLVLTAAFPLGQTLAPGDEGFMPTALGHALWTSPKVPGQLGQAEIRGAGHSDYWGWKEDTRGSQGIQANAAARDSLKLEPLADRAVFDRPAIVRNASEAREVGMRELNSRELPNY